MTCAHNSMVRNNSRSHAWKCAECGHIYGESKEQREFTEDTHRQRCQNEIRRLDLWIERAELVLVVLLAGACAYAVLNATQ